MRISKTFPALTVALVLLGGSSAIAQHNWEYAGVGSQNRCASVQLSQTGTPTGNVGFTIRIESTTTGTVWIDANYTAFPDGHWADTGGGGSTAIGVPHTMFSRTSGSAAEFFGATVPDNATGQIRILVRLGTSASPGATKYDVTKTMVNHNTGASPGYNGCHAIDGSFSILGVTDHVANFAMSVSGPCADQVTLEVGGSAVGLTSIAGGTGLGAQLTGDHTGQTVVWKKNGTVIASGSLEGYEYQAGSPEYPQGYYYSTNLGPATTCTEPTPTPTPTPSPTPTPTATPTPSPTPSPTPTPIFTPNPNNTPYPNPQPNGSPGAPVDIANMRDFYDAVKAGVHDSAEVPSFSGNGIGEGPAFTEERGKLDTLGDEIDEGHAKQDAFRNALANKVQGMADAFEGETTLGKVYTVTAPTVTFPKFGAYTLNLNLNPYRAWCDLIREFLLWLLAIAFFFLYLGALSSFVHGGK